MSPQELEQCRSALRLANETRLTNAKLQRDIRAMNRKDGLHYVADLLDANMSPANALPVGRLVTCVRQLGTTKLYVVTRIAGIFAPERRVRDLTERQRKALAVELRVRARAW